MTTASYHVIGVGLGADDLRYIGWTQRSLDDEEDQIVSELVTNGNGNAHAAFAAADGARLSIFEIEAVPSAKDAMDSAHCWCDYFNSLGLQVTCAHAAEAT